MVLLSALLALSFIREKPHPIVVRACAATASSETPESETEVCCPQTLTQTPSNLTNVAGILTFTYDNSDCSTAVSATCSAAIGQINTNVALIANQVTFLSTGLGSTSYPGTCDEDGNWNFGNPPLINPDLECILSSGTALTPLTPVSVPVPVPVTILPPVTLLPPVAVCCPALTQTPNTLSNADGILSFVYNNPSCPSSVSMTCLAPTGLTTGITTNVAILANQGTYLSTGLFTISATGICDSNGFWEFGTPPLINPTLECILSNGTVTIG